jgi:hypothetical protein
MMLIKTLLSDAQQRFDQHHLSDYLLNAWNI